MLRTIVGHRSILSFMLSCGTGYALLKRYPFPADDPVLQLILLSRPWLFLCLHQSYEAMLFSTPLIAFSSAFALLYIFAVNSEPSSVRNPLPGYPHPAGRDRLFLVVGGADQGRHCQGIAIPDSPDVGGGENSGN